MRASVHDRKAMTLTFNTQFLEKYIAETIPTHTIINYLTPFHYQKFYRTSNKFTKMCFFPEYMKRKSRVKLLPASERVPKFMNKCNKNGQNIL